jgi:hypothetical protein
MTIVPSLTVPKAPLSAQSVTDASQFASTQISVPTNWQQIDLRDLKRDKNLQYRLRNEVLINNLDKIEEYVEYGVAPLFGYAPICFSPVTAKEYWSIILKPVMSKNKKQTSVEEFFKAIDKQDKCFDKLYTANKKREASPFKQKKKKEVKQQVISEPHSHLRSLT